MTSDDLGAAVQLSDDDVWMKHVTVLMPVYNGAEHLAEAIESILRQTFRDFELLIVDDGSTDNSAGVVRGYRDKRVRLLQNPTNLGIVASLNRGLDAASSLYVARMDADDVSHPDRLTKQVAFLDHHPDVGVCGAWVELFGTMSGISKGPTEHDAIRCHMLFSNAFSHPTVVLRSDVLARHGLRYDATATHAEDYDLWVRSAEHTRLANLAEPLVRYRVHEASIGSRFGGDQDATADRIRRHQLAALGVTPTPAEAALHGSLGSRRFRLKAGFLDEVERWLRRLDGENRVRRRYPDATFTATLTDIWRDAAGFAAHHGEWPVRPSASTADPLALPSLDRAILLRRWLVGKLRMWRRAIRARSSSGSPRRESARSSRSSPAPDER